MTLGSTWRAMIGNPRSHHPGGLHVILVGSTIVEARRCGHIAPVRQAMARMMTADRGCLVVLGGKSRAPRRDQQARSGSRERELDIGHPHDELLGPAADIAAMRRG